MGYVYKVYAESGTHAEAICVIDAAYYDAGLSELLEKYFKKARMFTTEAGVETISIDQVFKLKELQA